MLLFVIIIIYYVISYIYDVFINNIKIKIFDNEYTNVIAKIIKKHNNKNKLMIKKLNIKNNKLHNIVNQHNNLIYEYLNAFKYYDNIIADELNDIYDELTIIKNIINELNDKQVNNETNIQKLIDNDLFHNNKINDDINTIYDVMKINNDNENKQLNERIENIEINIKKLIDDNILYGEKNYNMLLTKILYDTNNELLNLNEKINNVSNKLNFDGKLKLMKIFHLEKFDQCNFLIQKKCLYVMPLNKCFDLNNLYLTNGSPFFSLFPHKINIYELQNFSIIKISRPQCNYLCSNIQSIFEVFLNYFRIDGFQGSISIDFKNKIKDIFFEIIIENNIKLIDENNNDITKEIISEYQNKKY